MRQLLQSSLVLRANLRRDWIKILIWIIVLSGLFITVAAKFKTLYGTTAQIETIARTLRAPAMIALFGPVPKGGTLTTATIFATEMLIFWSLFLIICNLSLAINASRTQESAGLTELILGGYPVGRLAPLNAAALELTIVDGSFALITGLGTTLAAMPGSDLEGNWLFALTLAAVGWAFGMITLVFAQLVVDSHTANIYGYAFLGLAYVIRMLTDVQNSDWTWLSPLGWIEKSAIYTQNHWLPLGLLIVLGGGALILAFCLNAHRDSGTGILPEHAGHQRSRFLRGPLTLLLWQQRTTSLFWLLGLCLLGVSYGSIFDTLGQIVNQSPVVQQVLGTTGMHHLAHLQLLHFMNLLGVIFTVLASIAGTFCLNHLYTDERKGYLQLVHTRTITRARLYWVYLGFALVLTASLIFVALMGTMLAANQVLTQPLAFHYFAKVWLAMLPISWGFLAIAAVAIGWLLLGRQLIWFILGGSFVITYFGRLLNLPHWALNLSPFHWFDQIPLHTINISRSMAVLSFGLVVIVLGLIGYRHRDLQD
ncbi:ABC transporter permease [Lactobacillus sp. CC-MHH1034]|uniref:ABC transporter permease n=1 Tax=Agrilactobacillus fermenti TaxID=2586909 RepID=UPI001E5D303F|nr:ABC transporter permease [Agrilactobacillus fermenti]MCD2256281.1 ABC transporter permease [Agrilactobacillus fermenti]